MRSFVIKPGDLIPIGRAGENQATEIRFDVTGWAETFGAGSYALVMRRPGEDTVYPITVATDGDYVVWVVSNVDTGIVGNAQVQLRYTVDGALAKSVIYRGIVGESLDNIVDPPDPYEDLIGQMVDLTERAEAAAESASGSAGTATTAAEAAQTAKTAAETAAGQAQSAKEAAQASATTATQAKTAAQSAQTAAEAAQASAAQSATAASGSATAAAGSASQAAASATAAAASAATLTLDDTLTSATQAAQAKATGDRIVAAENGYKTPTAGNFTNGTWSGGAISVVTNRICTSFLYPVKKGDAIYIKTATLQVAHGIYQAGATASTDYKTWHYVADGAFYYAPVDGNMFFQLKKSNDATVSPSEYDATIQVYTGKLHEVEAELAQISTVMGGALDNIVDYGFESDKFTYKVTTVANLEITKLATHISVNGFNTSSAGVRIRVNNLTATYNSNDVAAWNTGLTLKPGHTYVVENKLIAGSISLSGSATNPTMSVYATGTSVSAGNGIYTATGSKRFFTAEYGKVYNLVLFVNNGTTLTNAVYEVILRDLTDELANATKSVRAYTKSGSIVAQSFAYVDGCLYVYHSSSPTGITKVDLRTGTETEYPFAFDHGNDMTVYNGKLYICSMNDSGTIHMVDLATMTDAGSVNFTIGGTPAPNSGIAYDAVNNQFIIKTADKFVFADTSLVYKSGVSISYIDAATSQGIETDGKNIYWVKYSPNEIEVFDYTGAFVDSIKISTPDEPESMCRDANGGWWLLTNVTSGGWYFDAIQITKNLDIGQIASIVSTFSALN